LLAQSFPVYKALTSGRPLCSFAVPAVGDDGAEYRRTAMIEQAGNAMHSMVCGIGLLFAVTQIEKVEVTLMSPALLGIANQLFSM